MNCSYIQKYYYLLILGFALCFSSQALSQTLTITGTAPVLIINAGTPGGQLTSVTNQVCRLTYGTPTNPRQNWRITVNTDNTSPLYTLTVVALNPTRGTAEAAVTLNSSTAMNFITAIPRNRTGMRCNLLYTASATFDQGIGTDLHRVTYTLLTP